MMIRLQIVLTMLGIALSAPAAAAGSTDSTGSSATENIVVTAPRYENKVVCKYQAPVGSRISNRVCYTNKEWDDMRDGFIRLAHEMIDSPKINPNP